MASTISSVARPAARWASGVSCTSCVVQIIPGAGEGQEYRLAVALEADVEAQAAVRLTYAVDGEGDTFALADYDQQGRVSGTRPWVTPMRAATSAWVMRACRAAVSST